jgi:hypothetical protein
MARHATGLVSDVAEFGALALFISMVLVWADALPFVV